MLPSGLPEAVASEEDIARFLTSRGHFNSVMVKPAAFMPAADHKKSVCRHGRAPEDDLRRFAAMYLPPGTNVYGAGVCKADDARALRLDVVAEEPPARHANIIGWPIYQVDSDLQKAAEKEIAGILASRCGAPLLFPKQ